MFSLFGKKSAQTAASEKPKQKLDGAALTAQYNLGVGYLNGIGGPRDLKKAYEAFLVAAELGHPRAQYNLGIMYNTGTYVSQDSKAAASWLAKAAQQRHGAAAFNLANLFLKGRGVEQDNQQAHLYMCLAADNGHAGAAEYVAKFLSSRGLDREGAPKDSLRVGDESLSAVPTSDDEVTALCAKIAQSLPKRLLTEQDVYWFVVEQYDRLITCGGKVEEILSNSPLFHIEHRGSRSETSYVGQPNPGVVFLDHEVMPPLEKIFGQEVAQRIRATIYVLFCSGFESTITQLRLKYANHYHNNCVSEGHYNTANEWEEVISALT